MEQNKPTYWATGTVIDGDMRVPLAGTVVEICDSLDVLIHSLVTTVDGRYDFRILQGKNYKIRAAKEGFFKFSTMVYLPANSKRNLVTNDLRLFPREVDKVIRLDNIFYDYALWSIRPDAEAELDKLVAVLLDNPTVNIELSAHTDCLGNARSNLELSIRRAKSARDYIISRGVPQEKVKSKGYGETKPAEACKCNECTQLQLQKNRRTEFKILSW